MAHRPALRFEIAQQQAQQRRLARAIEANDAHLVTTFDRGSQTADDGCATVAKGHICGLDYQIEGLEHIPRQGFIVMSKHSSTWETIALQKFFAPMVWVVKHELIHIPFFGWGLWAMDAIAINRGTGRQAINQLVDEGSERMQQGRIIMLFPEGTRVLPGQYKPFKLGGAILAHKSGYSILPIAHNAGEFWPRHSLIKWPGTIRVVIGKPIDPADLKPEQIIQQVESWVLDTCRQISDPQQLQRIGVQPQD